MDFLTATILSGIIYDQLKKGGELTGKYIKENLRGWLIEDIDSEMIVNKVNLIDEPYKKSKKILAAVIEEDQDFMDIIKNIKPKNIYEQNNNNSINNGNFINGNSNSTGNIINNYYGVFTQDNLQETNNNKVHDEKLLKLFNKSIREYIKILLDNDFSIQPTSLNLTDKFDEIIKEWSFPDKKFLTLRLERNKLEIIQALSDLNSYLKSPIYFRENGNYTFIIPVKDPERKIFTEMKNNTFNLRKNIIERYNEINSKNI